MHDFYGIYFGGIVPIENWYTSLIFILIKIKSFTVYL